MMNLSFLQAQMIQVIWGIKINKCFHTKSQSFIFSQPESHSWYSRWSILISFPEHVYDTRPSTLAKAEKNELMHKQPRARFWLFLYQCVRYPSKEKRPNTIGWPLTRADYLTVDEITFFLKEKQDSNHRPTSAGSDSTVQRCGKELWSSWGWHLLSTHCVLGAVL